MSSDSTPPDEQPQPGKGAPIPRPPKASGRTVQDWIMHFERADGTRGLTVRELTGAMHIAAERLRVVVEQPERLSLASLYGLAELLRIAPAQLIADVFHQVSVRNAMGLLHNGGRPR